MIAIFFTYKNNFAFYLLVPKYLYLVLIYFEVMFGNAEAIRYTHCFTYLYNLCFQLSNCVLVRNPGSMFRECENLPIGRAHLSFIGT